MKGQIIEAIEKNKIIAIIRGLDKQNCVRTAEALYHGGIKLVEVTFNQKETQKVGQTLDAIRAIRQTLDKRVWVGAGTVTSPELARLAKEAGAAFIISPDANADVIRVTGELGMVSIPGALTATEVLAAHRAGADFVKLFPAASLGTGYLKALRSPINHVKFLAVGGIDQSNLKDFLQAGAYGLGVGGCLVKQQWIEEGNFQGITELAKEFCRAAEI